ncbi:MAG: InlB B-repeat-containing protein, partial [Clostridia bacterium]|nr:InlB B-repeat-containing protein [Clostridia bacterium]
GNGNVNKQEKIYKKDLTLSNTTPTRTDYEFIGWSTNKNATVAQYQAGDKYTANSDATLYAIWKVNHNYTTKMIAPTCTEKGYTLYTCTNCGNSYKESYTNATGHKYVNEVIEATTAEQGYTLHTCSVCDHFYKDNYTNKLLTNTSTLSATAIILGNTIKVTATATGGTGEYQYQVVYKQKAQTKWTTAQAYKANANISFKPGKATSYDVCVKVKDNKETEVKKFFTVIVNDVLKNNSTVSSTTINLGNTVTVTAKATGGAGNYTYGVYYKKTSDTKWITKQNFKTNEKVTIKPAKATTYDICIKVKDGNGTTVKKYFKVNVTQLINISTLSATSIKLGDTIQVSCFARGSTGFYQYAVYYKKTSDTKWTTKQNYSANYTASIKPAKATTYDICVKVKDNLNNESKKYFTVIVK